MTSATANVDDYPPPRPAQGGAAARAAIMRATTLAVMVRDEGPDTIGPYLDDLDRAQLYAVVVALAAMVDPDVDVVEERLAWLVERGQQLERDLAKAYDARRRQAARSAAA